MIIRINTICAGALACLAGVASADTVPVAFEGLGTYGHSASVHLYNGLHFGDGSSHKTIWAGQLRHKIDGDSTTTFCTELSQWVGAGDFEIVEVADAPTGPGMGQARAEAIYKLFNATNAGQDIDTDAKAAAFQAAIWEIVYDFDNGLGLNGGSVQITDGVSSSTVQAYLDLALDAQGDKTPRVIAYSHESFQDQLGLRIVPLPGVAAMAGLGLGGIATRRRRQF